MSGNEVTLHDKTFSVFINAEEIKVLTQKVAAQIESDLAGECPIFIGVLNGAVFFVTDLLRELKMDCELGFIGVSSYDGMKSKGKVTLNLPLEGGISGRTVVLVEDIVDSGLTLQFLLENMDEAKPKALKTAALLYKPDAFKGNYKVDYIGKEIPNDFVVGYGLDYNGIGRNLKDIYKLKQTT